VLRAEDARGDGADVVDGDRRRMMAPRRVPTVSEISVRIFSAASAIDTVRPRISLVP
jgi:hypothetical protein